MTVVDISSIQTVIRNRVPRPAQQATSCMANRISENPKTSGSAFINYDGIENLPQVMMPCILLFRIMEGRLEEVLIALELKDLLPTVSAVRTDTR